MIIRCLVLLALTAQPAFGLVGGAQPLPGAHPAVMIVGSRGNSCTAVAIARDLVLTAAHCVEPGADYKLVEFDAQRQPLLRDAVRIERHPQFIQKSFDAHRATADVALIKFSPPLRSGVIAPIHGEQMQIGSADRFTVSGYGLTEPGNGKSGGVLRSVVLTVTGRPGNLQIRLMDPSTRNERAGLGACTGDSGGPVFRDIDGRLKLVGVVSWSTGPGNSAGCGGLTGVTPLSLYYQWINDTARKLGSPLQP